MQENPDPFDSYREENSDPRDLFSVLPPLSMSVSNYGPTTNNGTSTREETTSSASVFASPTMSTPRQKSLSVSEALGIGATGEGTNLTPRNGGLATIEDVESPSPRSQSPSPSPGIVRDRSPSSPTTMTLIPASQIQSEVPDSIPTPLSVENLSLNSSQSDRSHQALSPKRERVVEEEEKEEVDPMSGDWESNRDYGQSLSPVGHDYSSDE